jgi:hypothetical protein
MAIIKAQLYAIDPSGDRIAVTVDEAGALEVDLAPVETILESIEEAVAPLEAALTSLQAALAPATDRVPVAKDDEAADPAGPYRGFFMDAEGALTVTLTNGQTRTYASGAFAAKTDYTLTIARVWETGTGSQNVWGIK